MREPSDANAEEVNRDEVRYGYFFQAEDGIRDLTVTGVQTCALPISISRIACASRSSARSWFWRARAGAARCLRDWRLASSERVARARHASAEAIANARAATLTATASPSWRHHRAVMRAPSSRETNVRGKFGFVPIPSAAPYAGRKGLTTSATVGSGCITASGKSAPSRSEERRVGKEGRSRWSPDH